MSDSELAELPASSAEQTPAPSSEQQPDSSGSTGDAVSLDKEMAAAYDRVMSKPDGEKPAAEAKAERARDPATQRFVKAEAKAETKAEGETDEEAEKPDGEAAKASEATSEKFPNAWPDQIRKGLAAVPADVRQWLTQREQQFAQRNTEIGRTLKAFEPFDQVLGKHQEVFTKAHPAAVLDHLIEERKALMQDPVRGIFALAEQHQVDIAKAVLGPDPSAAIRTIAESAGIDLLDLALAAAPTNGQQPQRQAQPQAPADDPRLTTVQQKLAAIEAQNQALMARLHQREAEEQDRALLGEVDSFAQQAPDLVDLAPLVITNIQKLRASNPELSNRDVLQLATEQARRLVDERVTAATQKKLKEQATIAARSKSASAANVRGTNGASNPAALSEQAEIDQLWQRIGLS